MILKVALRAPGCLSQLSVRLLILAQALISGSWDRALVGLRAGHGVCLGFSLSLSLCPSPAQKENKVIIKESILEKLKGHCIMFIFVTKYMLKYRLHALGNQE